MSNILLKGAKAIDGKDSFLQFMALLVEDFKTNKASWENQDLLTFLEAASAWIQDMDELYINQGGGLPDNVSWRVFADILLAARVYE